jgi:Tfp pilus assembly protein PilO
MSQTLSTLRGLLKNRRIVLTIGAAAVIVLVWLIAFYAPQGKNLSKYQTQRQQLQQQQAGLEAQLVQLRATSRAVPKLVALQSQLEGLIPPTPDIYNYITLMSNTATASGIQLVSLTPTNTPAPVAGTDLQSIAVTLTANGTYDDTLGFMKAIYALPRLTVINSVTISGGGPTTNRGTVLDDTFSLTIYTTAKPTTPSAG